VCPNKAIHARNPGSLYKISINRQTNIKATIPASTPTFNALEPSIGLIEFKSLASKANGIEPDLISFASFIASSMVL
jgi:hypothetical protein